MKFLVALCLVFGFGFAIVDELQKVKSIMSSEK